MYATWIEITTSNATHVVVAWCAVGAGGELCDDADAWQGPHPVTSAQGSYIYPDVATGPAGDVYVVWWDYSNANAIRGARCAAPCSDTFGPAETIALLDATDDVPLPFACPIVVAPGGRVGPTPSVEVAPDGRVYASWSDLRPGSGSTRCEAGSEQRHPAADQPSQLGLLRRLAALQRCRAQPCRRTRPARG